MSSGQAWFAEQEAQEKRAEEEQRQRWEVFLKGHAPELIRCLARYGHESLVFLDLHRKLYQEFGAAERVRKTLLEKERD